MGKEMGGGHMAERIIRLGIAGLGRAAVSVIPQLVRHPGFRMVAAAEPRAIAREAFVRDFDARAYTHFEALCGDREIDAVYIATPQEFHADYGILAAQAGKHIFMEKPIALTLEDAKRLQSAVEQAGVVLLVGRGSHGFDAPVLQIRNIVSQGTYGPVRMMHTWAYTDFMYRPRRSEEMDESRGGGVLFNQGPHQIDLLRVIAGAKATRVQARAWQLDPSRPVSGTYTAWLEFANGTVATMVYSGYDRFDPDVFHGWIGTYGGRKRPDHHGSTRRALYDRIRQGTDAALDEATLKAEGGYGGAEARVGNEAPALHPHWGVTVATCERADLVPTARGVNIYGESGLSEYPVPLGRGMRGNAVDEFYRAVAKAAPTMRDGRWELASLEICLAIRQSAKQGRAVRLSHQIPVDDAWVEEALENIRAGDAGGGDKAKG